MNKPGIQVVSTVDLEDLEDQDVLDADPSDPEYFREVLEYYIEFECGSHETYDSLDQMEREVKRFFSGAEWRLLEEPLKQRYDEGEVNIADVWVEYFSQRTDDSENPLDRIEVVHPDDAVYDMNVSLVYYNDNSAF